ncbi:SPARC-related modular calcium-binding protein 1, partial [Zootermopsis nevadensis]
PTCLPDGTFAPVQCHAETGYCWCVTPVGKPIPNSSLHNARPNCRRGAFRVHKGENLLTSRWIMSSSSSKLHGVLCGSDERSTFNKNLVKIFKTEYNRVSTALATDRQVLDWKFSVMDKDKDNFLEKPEYRDLRRLVKKAMKPKRCAKTFTKLCDLDNDQRISREEWASCLGLDFNHESQQEGGAEKTESKVQRGKILMKNSIMLFSDKDIIQIINLFTGNDCHSDRKAVLEEQKINYSEFYVPECTPDGRYQTIQCYKSTGYCWCVHEDSGKPIPGTSVKDQVPKCDTIPAPLRPMNGCPDPRKQAFLRELMDLMKKKMEASKNQTSTESYSVPIKETWQESTEEQIAAWNFLMLDKNKNKVLERKEWKHFRALVSSNPQLRRCGKRLPRYCDVNNDRKISITEWLNCLSTQRTNS